MLRPLLCERETAAPPPELEELAETLLEACASPRRLDELELVDTSGGRL